MLNFACEDAEAPDQYVEYSFIMQTRKYKNLSKEAKRAYAMFIMIDDPEIMASEPIYGLGIGACAIDELRESRFIDVINDGAIPIARVNPFYDIITEDIYNDPEFLCMSKEARILFAGIFCGFREAMFGYDYEEIEQLMHDVSASEGNIVELLNNGWAWIRNDMELGDKYRLYPYYGDRIDRCMRMNGLEMRK